MEIANALYCPVIDFLLILVYLSKMWPLSLVYFFSESVHDYFET